MEKSYSSHQKFEKLIAKLFVLQGNESVSTNITYTYFIDHTCELDIVFGEGKKLSLVEVKSYRIQNPPSISQFLLALKTTKDKKGYIEAKNAFLILSCELNNTLKKHASDEYPDIQVWDIKDVLRNAIPFEDLYQELLLHLEINPSALILDENKHSNENETFTHISSGQSIINALQDIEPGRTMSVAYENVCIQALKHIFNTDLAGWHEQSETLDGLTRRDLICRVLPNSEVWQLILNDLQSRYVVFEFKNYSNPITQKEIITTEKYLYTTALRRVAFIITQNGHSESAFKVMEGAMREHGKMMLPLTTQDLIDLIHMKDDGSDPNSYIFDIVDKFLIRLGR